VINFSIGAFLLLAFSTSSNILDTVDSPYSFVTRMVITPFKFTTPAKTSSSGTTSLGMDSPVNAEVSNELEPFMITPSNGSLSPGFTSMISSTFISCGSTLFSTPFTNRLA